MARRALSWGQLSSLTNYAGDALSTRTNGPTNSQAALRLFGASEADVRLTLYRDKHAWCPYCQKIWLWLEEKRVPYRIEKVTMFCYGDKEPWYKKICPSGMLPAVQLDGQVITESDVILEALEGTYGALYKPMHDPAVMPLRKLERSLFSAWCQWLCRPARNTQQDQLNQLRFEAVLEEVEAALQCTEGAFFLEEFSTADVVFVPYVERMSASLYYYKGFTLRDPEARPALARWFEGLEARSTYLGTQSDFHTHCHDLPPQMGGCYANGTPQQQAHQQQVDAGPWDDLPDALFQEPPDSTEQALHRVLKHKESMLAANPEQDRLLVDEALRCALTYMMTRELVQPPASTDACLRYIRDRVNVPRDMSLHSARRLREALETTAALAGSREGPEIPVQHRRDQDPRLFGRVGR